MNETIKYLERRISLRKYAQRQISQQHMDMIIEGAMRAPTAGNMMLYSILVVEDQDKKDILSETCDHQPFISKAPFVLIFLADMQRWYDYYDYSKVKEFCQEKGEPFVGPQESDLLLACSDALIAAQNAVITAESLDIGSCYIGDIMENYEIHKELFNLPPWTFPIAMLCFGYYPEGERPAPRERFHREYIVFKDHYNRLSPEDLEKMFQCYSHKFSLDNKFRASNFGQLTYARKTGASFSKEMARSVKVALKQWQGEIL